MTVCSVESPPLLVGSLEKNRKNIVVYTATGFLLEIAYGMSMPFFEKHAGCEPGIPFYYTDFAEKNKVRWLSALPIAGGYWAYCLSLCS